MRKSFFKKLSLGLALALVLGTTAQAGTAKAAATWALTKSSKTLYLNADNSKGAKTPVKDNYDFNFAKGVLPENWKKLYNFEWVVEDETVATHSKSGKVQAVSVGETTIECIVTSKENGKVVATASADIIVKENAADIEITNKDEYDTVKPGDVVDLNRAMYNEAGQKTTKRGTLVTDYTRWVAYDYLTGEEVGADVVSIKQSNGQFTMHKDGYYVLEAQAYQSSKYPAARVTDSVLVVVEAPFVIDQKTENVFTIELPTEDAAKAITDVDSFFISKADDHENNLFVKSISRDKNVVKVTMLEDLIDKMEYTVRYGSWDFKGLTGEFTQLDGYEGTFVASVGRPAKVELVVANRTEANKNVLYVYHPYNMTDVNKATLKFYDENDTDVTNLYAQNPSTYGYVDFVYENTADIYFNETAMDTLEIEVFKAGRYNVTVEYTPVNATTGELEKTMTFPTYLIAQEKGNAKLTFSDITSWGLATYDIEGKKYNELATVATKWISSSDFGAYLVVVAKDDQGNLVTTAGVHGATDAVATSLMADKTGFTFKSQNDRIASIDETSGLLTPNATGKVKIAIYYADPYNQEATPAYVGAVEVEVRKDRELANLTFNKLSTSLVSNVIYDGLKDDLNDEVTNVVKGDQAEFTFVPTLVDQYGEKWSCEDLIVENEDLFVKSYNPDNNAFVGYKFNIASVVDEMKATEKKTLEFTTKVYVDGMEDDSRLCKTLRVTVRKPATSEIKSYVVEIVDANGNAVESKNFAYNAVNAGVEIKVYGKNYEGYRVHDLTLAGDVAYAEDGMTADEYAKEVAVEGELFYVITKNNKVVAPVAPAATRATVASAPALTIVDNKLGVVGYTNEDVVSTLGAVNKATVAESGQYTVTLYSIKKSAATGKFGAIRMNAADTFTVSNDPNPIVVKQDKTSIAAGVADVTTVADWYVDPTLVSAVMDCFSVSIDKKFGEADTATTPIAIKARLNNNVLFVQSIRIYTQIGTTGVYTEHEVYVGKYIRVNQ